MTATTTRPGLRPSLPSGPARAWCRRSTIRTRSPVRAPSIREAFGQLRRGAPDLVVVPVGGGGLLAGTLAWLAANHPGVRVVGVEPAGAASMAAALKAGRPVDAGHLDTFTDGAAVRRIGTCRSRSSGPPGPRWWRPAEGKICTEMLEFYQVDGIIAEPAGALAAAALRDTIFAAPGSTILCLLSGGNNDVSRYAEVIERSLVHERRKHYFLVDFPQEPGALRQFLDEVLGPDDDITLFEYVKRNNRETGPALVGIELGRPEDLSLLMDRMKAGHPEHPAAAAGQPDGPLPGLSGLAAHAAFGIPLLARATKRYEARTRQAANGPGPGFPGPGPFAVPDVGSPSLIEALGHRLARRSVRDHASRPWPRRGR